MTTKARSVQVLVSQILRMKFMGHRKKHFVIGSLSRRVPESGIPLSLRTGWGDGDRVSRSVQFPFRSAWQFQSCACWAFSERRRDKNNPDSWYLQPPVMVERGTFLTWRLLAYLASSCRAAAGRPKDIPVF